MPDFMEWTPAPGTRTLFVARPDQTGSRAPGPGRDPDAGLGDVRPAPGPSLMLLQKGMPTLAFAYRGGSHTQQGGQPLPCPGLVWSGLA
jgi:hypothetical protein